MANLKLYASLAAAVIWALFLELCRLLLRLSKRLVRLIARRRGRTKPTGTDGKLPARRGSYLRLAKALLKLGLAAAAVLAVGAGIGYILQLMNPLIR
jgi:type VI protein secretion system component VasF